jgi:hypothetical protein
MISLSARAVTALPFRVYSTPTARPPRMTMRWTSAPVSMVRFGRPIAGRR